MGIKSRIVDISFIVFARMRHKRAFEVAVRPGTAADFSGLAARKHALLVTFRKDGSAVPTPIWFALHDDRHLVTRTEGRTAKLVRLRNDPRARVFPCDARGKPLGPGVEATGRFLDGPECAAAEAALDRRYGATRRVYERLMSDAPTVVYLELVPATQGRPPVRASEPGGGPGRG